MSQASPSLSQPDAPRGSTTNNSTNTRIDRRANGNAGTSTSNNPNKSSTTNAAAVATGNGNSGADSSSSDRTGGGRDAALSSSGVPRDGTPNTGLLPTTGFEALTGLGVRGVLAGHRVAIGNSRLMESEGAMNTYSYTQASEYEAQSETITRTSLSLSQGGADRARQALAFLLRAEHGARTAVLVSIDGVLSGAIEVSDPVKVEARPVVEYLSRMGIRSLLVTGDSWGIARAVAAAVGIPEANVLAEVLPAGKADRVRALQVSCLHAPSQPTPF